MPKRCCGWFPVQPKNQSCRRTFRSRLLLPLPVPGFTFRLCFWKLEVDDQGDGSDLGCSSGPAEASSTRRPARDGSLLRRTWRGISARGEKLEEIHIGIATLWQSVGSVHDWPLKADLSINSNLIIRGTNSLNQVVLSWGKWTCSGDLEDLSPLIQN